MNDNIIWEADFEIINQEELDKKTKFRKTEENMADKLWELWINAEEIDPELLKELENTKL